MGFVQHSFGLGFVAVVVRARFIERAVEAAMQIGSAGRALRLPPDKKIIRDFIFAFMANFHEKKIQAHTGYCQAALSPCRFTPAA
jgi:hypothetical protein